MSQLVTITITIEVPDGAAVSTPAATVPVSQPVAAPVVVEQSPLHDLAGGWNCPNHHGHRVVPAGVSAKSGKSYHAFRGCPEKGCDEKGPA
jgi:hypothetical protein